MVNPEEMLSINTMGIVQIRNRLTNRVWIRLMKYPKPDERIFKLAGCIRSVIAG